MASLETARRLEVGAPANAAANGTVADGIAVDGTRKYTAGVDAYFTAESTSHGTASQDDEDLPDAEEYKWVTSRGAVKDMRTMNLSTLKTAVYDDLVSTLFAEEHRLKMRDSDIVAGIEGLRNTEAVTFDGPGGEVGAQAAMDIMFKLFKDYKDNAPALDAVMRVVSTMALGYLAKPCA